MSEMLLLSTSAAALSSGEAARATPSPMPTLSLASSSRCSLGSGGDANGLMMGASSVGSRRDAQQLARRYASELFEGCQRLDACVEKLSRRAATVTAELPQEAKVMLLRRRDAVRLERDFLSRRLAMLAQRMEAEFRRGALAANLQFQHAWLDREVNVTSEADTSPPLSTDSTDAHDAAATAELGGWAVQRARRLQFGNITTSQQQTPRMQRFAVPDPDSPGLPVDIDVEAPPALAPAARL